MNEQEVHRRLDELMKGMRWFDLILDSDKGAGEVVLTEQQEELVRGLFELFEHLHWQMQFNHYRELRCPPAEHLNQRGCGTPVKIRPCAKEYGGRTYFGVLLGDLAHAIEHTVEDGVVTAKPTQYNPAIFVPELRKVIMGFESWWGKIKSAEDLKKIISDDTINNTWYVQALADLCGKNQKEEP